MSHQTNPVRPVTYHVVTFGRVLRDAGLQVGAGQIMDALRAMAILGVERRADVYQAFYSIFVTRHEESALFEQAFHLFWRAPSRIPEMMGLLLPTIDLPRTAQPKQSLRVRQAIAQNTRREGLKQRKMGNEDKEAVDLVLTYSPSEVLRKKDFASFSSEEVALAKQMLRDLVWSLGEWPVRRFKPADTGRRFDMRNTIRRSLRNQGEMISIARKSRKRKPRPLAILCDISGSMERYSRMLIHFLHTMAASRHSVETFVFGTRLTRITRTLRLRDIDDAVSEVSQRVNDWSGGTRIGESIKAFNYTWARRVLRSGAVVLIISDGWDRGEVQLLEREMGRLARSCHRLLWLNPLLGFQDYEPLTRGIKAALPHVDHFLPVHNLESMEQIAEILGKI